MSFPSEPKRYSQLYEKGENLVRDSARMRLRLLKTLESYCHGYTEPAISLARLIERRCGIDIVVLGGSSFHANWDKLFRDGELRDIFDTLTLAFREMPDEKTEPRFKAVGRREAIRKEFSQILDEEMVGYFLDEEGIVHPRVDEAFEGARRSLIDGLKDDKYAAARNYLDDVDRALLRNPTDGRQAIRSVFDVVENIYKQAFQKETHINARSLANNLKPIVGNKYCDDKLESQVAEKMFSGFCNWVDSVHFYRHEAGRPEPSQPSEETTLAIVSQGYSHARWLLAMVSV
ncbi:hypothetical protein [Pseudosulfitobacter sp. DSM 107133]|uniref:hypothetical protein n=1 Tax=Pseudosulfitobacter sp. DSM 107133 TaxID=2883100 RepID=UPI0013B39193|nr:hypothetical protein [Pseudosulfitobacter sp. DSM 107133]UOA26433.1 hypothetical protein DSM107133_01133 [Pseudosulfitobacter sp. DSM 107133]